MPVDPRDFSLKNAIFASGAQDTIPTTPSPGTPYRNVNYNATDAANGWPYYNVVDSANFNQIMYLMTSLLDGIEKQGILYWSQQTDYPVGGICRDNADGNFYIALQASGPNNGGYKQPSSYPAHWTMFWGGSPLVITPGTATSGFDYVVGMNIITDANESKRWYRKWVSGWLEQGGYSIPTAGDDSKYNTIVFPLGFLNTDYIVTGGLCTGHGETSANGGGFTYSTGSTYASGEVPVSTTTTLYAFCFDGGDHSKNKQTMSWYAIGRWK